MYIYLSTPIAIILTSHPYTFYANSYHAFNHATIPSPHKLHCDTEHIYGLEILLLIHPFPELLKY